MGELTLGPDGLTVDDAAQVAAGTATLALSPEVEARVERAWQVACRIAERGDLVYGWTTGFGPLATTHVPADRAADLQRGLLAHLSSGVGDPLPDADARAVLVARVASIARGASGLSPAWMRHVLAVIASGWVPRIPSLGTVGASGDLTPLAHAARAMAGDGRMRRDGREVDAAHALREAGLTAPPLEGKDALALVNGTSAMTGMAVRSTVDVDRLLAWTTRLVVGFGEVLGAHRDAIDPFVDAVRPHAGQQWAAAALRRHAVTASRLRTLDRSAPADVALDAPLPQDAYTWRCAPQLIGALRDAAVHHREGVERELNAVTDNPLIDVERERAVHAGNFFGQHVAYLSDLLHGAVTSWAAASERRIARLCDPARNGGLPPMLTGGTPGLDSGLMGAQVAATSIVAWMRTQSVPASVQSISTNAANQDVVTMGTIGALRVRQALDRAWDLLAIEAIAVAQAVDLSGGDAFSDSTRTLVDTVRERVPTLTTDRPLSLEIADLAAAMRAVPTAVAFGE